MSPKLALVLLIINWAHKSIQIRFDSNFIRFFKNKRRMLNRSSSLTILTIIKMKEIKFTLRLISKIPREMSETLLKKK